MLLQKHHKGKPYFDITKIFPRFFYVVKHFFCENMFLAAPAAPFPAQIWSRSGPRKAHRPDRPPVSYR